MIFRGNVHYCNVPLADKFSKKVVTDVNVLGIGVRHWALSKLHSTLVVLKTENTAYPYQATYHETCLKYHLNSRIYSTPTASEISLLLLLLIATSTTVSAPSQAFAAPAAARMNSRKRVGCKIPTLLARLDVLHSSNSSLQVFKSKPYFYSVQANLIGKSGQQTVKESTVNFAGGCCFLIFP